MQQRTRPGGRGAPTRASGPRGAQRTGAAGAGRAPARPTVARRAVSSGGAAMRTRAPQPKRFTSRAVVLSLVLLALLLAYAYPVRVYLAQQAEITALEQNQERQSDKIARMAALAAKWDDNAYVRAQARQRLGMIMPGEKPFVVIDPSRGQQTDPAAIPGADRASRPWYGKLWSSVEAAD